MNGDQYLQYFFAQIDWKSEDQKILDDLKLFVSSIPNSGLRYEFKDFSPEDKKDVQISMAIYWTEILDRVHFASVTSLSGREASTPDISTNFPRNGGRDFPEWRDRRCSTPQDFC